MSAGALAQDVLLGAGCALTLGCCAALPLMADFYERLQFLAGVSTLGSSLVVAAVIVRERWGQAALKSCLCLAGLFLMNAVLAHATARAARVQEGKLDELD